jgi:acetyltransferase-like isoleucine patch superfamily enzyme
MKRFKRFVYFLIRFFYRDINKTYEPYSVKELCSYAFKQKFLGYNRNVPWPVHFTSQIKCPEKIQRGSKYPGFAKGCYIDGRNGILFEENVLTGPNVTIISQNHDKAQFDQFIDGKPIVIRKNSWLSANCIILPEVELGEHTIVAAGAVVTKSFTEGNQLLAGNPAKIIKKLDSYKS